MNKELKEFVSIGFLRYKEAHDIYWRFREEMQSLLINILADKIYADFFQTDIDSIFSKHWVNGLVLNARIDIFINGIKYSIGIGLDWYNSKNETPIPFVWLEDDKRNYISLQNNYNWKNIIYDKNHHLGYLSSFNIDELESIFDSLLNEIKGYTKQIK